MFPSGIYLLFLLYAYYYAFLCVVDLYVTYVKMKGEPESKISFNPDYFVLGLFYILVYHLGCFSTY